MLRMKAVKSMGEPTVNVLETGTEAGFTIFKRMKSGGIMGLEEFAKEKFSDLKDVCASGVNHHRRDQRNADHQSDRSGYQMAAFIAHSGCGLHQSHYGHQRHLGLLCRNRHHAHSGTHRSDPIQSLFANYKTSSN